MDDHERWKLGEMIPDELRQLLLFIARYAGYPRAAPLVGMTETAIAQAQEQSE